MGVVTGLAWTQVGGDTLTIEVSVVPGKGKVMITGQLGDVMRESAQTALSYVRSRAQSLGIPTDFAEKVDIHVHVPEAPFRRTDLRQGSPWPLPLPLH